MLLILQYTNKDATTVHPSFWLDPAGKPLHHPTKNTLLSKDIPRQFS